MATVLTVGDIAIVQYNSGTTDSFTFVFLRDVEAGTVVNFTDNGWLAAGGFRPGEGTVTYTAPSAITAGTTVTLSGLNLDDAGDQIIAYQGDPATPTILHVVDFADGNNTVAGDATNDNTTALPPGFALDVNAVAVGFDNAVYAGPNSGPPDELFPLINDPANWISSVSPSALYFYNDRPRIDLDGNNSTSFGEDYRANVISGGPAVAIADTDTDIDDFDDFTIFRAEIDIQGTDPGDLLSVNAALLPFGISASAFNPSNGTLTLFGAGSHSDYQNAIELVRFSTTQPVGTHKTIAVSVYDGHEWSSEAYAYLTVSGTAGNTHAPALDLDLNNSNGGGSDYTATFTVGGPSIPVADTDVSITDADIGATIASARITIGINRSPGDQLVAGSLPAGITASSYNSSTGVLTLSGSATLANYQTALRAVAFTTTNPFTADRIITVTVNDGTFTSNTATTYMHVAAAPPNAPPVNTVPGAQSVAEDTALPISGVSVADVDSSALTTTLSVSSGTIHVTPGAGVSGNDTANVTITGTAAQINAALAGLSYTGSLNFNGADTLTIATSDTIATDTDTIAITVNAVNDAPVNTVPGAQSVAEDTALHIAGVSVADVDRNGLTTTLNVSSGTIHVIAGAGVTGNGTASVTITGTAAQINTALAGLSYTGSLNFSGADTLTVKTTDGTATDTDTIAITVNAVNDAPVNTVPGAQSVAEDTLLPIAGVSVADVDSILLTTTLNVSSGTINVTAGLGVSGNGTASVTITGTAAQINTALAGLSYTGNLNFNAAHTLTVDTTDGTATDTDTIPITATRRSSALVNTVPGAQSVAEDTALPISGVSVADVDSSVLTTTLNVSSGTIDVIPGLGVSGNGTASVTITGTAAQINTALAGLSYTGKLNFNGADKLTV